MNIIGCPGLVAKKWVLFLGPVILIGAALAQSAARTVRINDDSDWWSSLRTDEDVQAKPDPIRTPDATLTISGVFLQDHHLLAAIKKKFGQAIDVERGDASTGRNQYCFVSASAGRKVYLIFEVGEIDSAFYLFTNGRDWNGSQYCRPSTSVSESVSAGGGLRLGMTRGEVERILGKPTLVRGDHLVYDREVSVKSTQEELARARAEAPSMNEKEFRENYGYWDLSTYIEARFKQSKLNYLAVSQGETQ